MEKDKIGYKVFAYEDSLQIIELELDPGHRIPAMPIFDKWIDQGITNERQALCTAKPAGGVTGTLLSSGKKKLGFDQHQVTYFRNPSRVIQRIAFAAPHGRQILPIPLCPADGDFFCHKRAFICCDPGIEAIANSGSRSNSNFVGSEKSEWLKFRGSGIIFVHVGGRFKNEKLENQTVKLDRRSIVGFTGGIVYDRGNVVASKLNGAGTKAYFRSKLSGSGTVYLQSKPYDMSRRANSLTRDIRELANSKALQLYHVNLSKIKAFRWSKLRGLLKTEQLKTRFKNRIILPGRPNKLNGKQD